MNLSESELLRYALDSGIIDIDTVQRQFEMNERKKYLELHPYSIWQGNDGKWHTYIPDENKGRIPKKRKTQNEIENLVIDYWKDKEEVITIKDVFEEWNNRRRDLGKISDATHLRIKQTFARHYSEFGKKNIKTLTDEDVADFLEEEIAKHKLTPRGFASLKSLTRGMLKRAKKRKLISFNIEEMFDDMDISDKDFEVIVKNDMDEVFDEVEYPIMIDYLISHIDMRNLAILLMFVTGCRVGEVVALKYDMFFNDNKSFLVQRTETRYKDEQGKDVYEVKDKPKTLAGIRTIIIPSDYHWIYGELRKLNPFGEYTFMDNGERLNTHQIRKRMYRICNKLGIKQKSPHKARKTYGSILLDNNLDAKFIETQMGHTSIQCSETYYHKNRRKLETRQKMVDDMQEFKIKQVF